MFFTYSRKVFTGLWNLFASKLFNKMILIYSLLTLLPLMLVIGIFYYKSSYILEAKITDAKKQSLVEMVDKIDGYLQDVADMAVRIQKDDFVETTLREDYFNAETVMESGRSLRVNQRLSDLMESNEFIDAIYIMNANRQLYYSESEFRLESMEALEAMAQEQPDAFVWAPFADHGRLAGAMEITNFSTGKKAGLIMIMLRPDRIAKAYSSYGSTEFNMTNTGGLILSNADPERVGTRFKPSANKEIIVLERQSAYSGFRFISLFSKAAFHQEIDSLAYFTLLITGVTWVLVLLLTVIVLRHVTTPLTRLSRLMGKAQKEVYETIDNIRTKDEVGRLCVSFNHLITDIRDLIQKVYKVELLNKEAELKAIKAQINPHFLYNTLESINIMAKELGSSSIPDMIRLLAEIFRFSISPGSDLIPLANELQFVSYYLQLAKYRYEERLIWTMDVSDELRQVIVPKLILQPLVENAIIHGIDRTAIQGVIAIRAYIEVYDLIIEIEDNGPGPELSSRDGRSSGIGLNNVRQRIELLYGNRYGLTIGHVGPQQAGALVRLRLPITLMKEGIS
ncbi:sensor histidine kinase [Paenibacillus eucommiae]|uniref:Sensor histidine kinase YesM n=1 Tax=Paenibacillus eucommiae TaxID=1355755 RepID=A0ABS4IPH0_9BACL|nr:histidine kinase [Paenibacillus eucommiae]MBP1989466.1 sensor histidine kinase YesM [Paenibacillus eucommiae]